MPQGTHTCPLMARAHTQYTHGKHTAHTHATRHTHALSWHTHRHDTHNTHTANTWHTCTHMAHASMTHTLSTQTHTQHGGQAKRQKRQVTICLLKPNMVLKHSQCNYQLCKGNLHRRTTVWLFLTALCQRLWQTQKSLRLWHLSFWSPSWHRETPEVTLLTLSHP